MSSSSSSSSEKKNLSENVFSDFNHWTDCVSRFHSGECKHHSRGGEYYILMKLKVVPEIDQNGRHIDILRINLILKQGFFAKERVIKSKGIIEH